MASATGTKTVGDFRELLRKARAGCQAALGQLLNSRWGWLCRRGRQEIPPGLRAKEHPSDLAQETLLRAFRAFHQFGGDDEAEFAAWLKQIQHHLALDLQRRQQTDKRQAAREVPLEAAACDGKLEDAMRPATASPGSDPMRREADEAVRRAVEQLPEHWRVVLRLHYHEGLSFAVAGRMLGCGEDAVRKACRRALSRLADKLGRQAG